MYYVAHKKLLGLAAGCATLTDKLKCQQEENWIKYERQIHCFFEVEILFPATESFVQTHF